jgi:ubiquinone biosynthesis protein COQ4
MARRYRDTHDIWHILTNYPTTAEGEMCMIMFSYAQTRSLAWLVISLSILFTLLIRRPLASFVLLRMVYEAYRNGKRAKFLLAEDYDKLLSENLDSARERLNIRLPKAFVNRSPNFLKL